MLLENRYLNAFLQGSMEMIVSNLEELSSKFSSSKKIFHSNAFSCTGSRFIG